MKAIHHVMPLLLAQSPVKLKLCYKTQEISEKKNEQSTGINGKTMKWHLLTAKKNQHLNTHCPWPKSHKL